MNGIYQMVRHRCELKNEKKVGRFCVIFMEVPMDIEVCAEEIHKSQKRH